MITIKLDEDELGAVVAAVKQAVKEQMQEMGLKPSSPEPGSKILYSIEELAAFMHVSISTAMKYKKEGFIPFQQVRRKVQFDANEVSDALLKMKRKEKTINREKV